jgi:hypothetical protein
MSRKLGAKAKPFQNSAETLASPQKVANQGKT